MNGKKKRLGNICSLITKGTTPKKFSESGVNFIKIESISGNNVEKSKCLFIDKDIHRTELKRSILQENDILFAIAGATIGKVAIVSKNILPANTNQALSIIRLKDDINNKFILNILTSKIMKKYIESNISVGAQPNLNLEQMNNFKFFMPSLEEQERIANFFTILDSLIEEQDGKVSDLELYKKGMLQKIFKQEIRFKDENGYDYPEWEESKLGDLGATYSGLSGKTKEDFGFGVGKYITYMNVFKNIKMNINMIDLVDINKNEKQNKVLKGDILFTASSETPEEVGMASVCDKEIENLYLNSFCFGFRLNSFDRINYTFMGYFFRSPKIRRKISILAQGSTRYNISKTELMKINIYIPCLEEQTRIADFLANIDAIIEEEKKKFEDLRQWKKGLLQHMFI